ncbi:MAG: thioredoxin domain-containing protein [Candidatus Helarchaeota archaeon]|nr:thioredoxin domain-containing protein [Candidatus Helarchaeota archaeon]
MIESKSKKSNQLITEKSPYLLQHAYNPVDWYPWGADAFEKARREDKPIFLSIGYSTCHWCHVMERESFEDPEVAKLMNESFVSIKVDREERPDIDKIYMTVCQAMTGRGGWPLTIIMTPEKKPFFAATYIPKKGRFGSAGILELIPTIRDYWINKREEALNSADTISQALQKVATTSQVEALGELTLATAYTQLVKRFDKHDGGFGGAPKFPTPHNILFLLRYWKRTGSEHALHMIEKTLQSMRRGGIFDQIGFGFHRYSTDDFWLLPHFEKMLYDQALLAMAYTEAYQATKRETYRTTAREIFTYVIRNMSSPLGGFYSAEDADSEDEEGKMVEGKFYLWTEKELQEIYEKDESSLASKIFNIKKGGNFLDQATQERTGENILHFTKSLADLALELKIPKDELTKRVDAIRTKLFPIREKRPHPHKDDKILTNWNGLMIAALAKAARVFEEPEYIEVAQKAINFIFQQLKRSDGRLLHRYRDGEAAILANIDDYTFLIWGLLELYETTFEATYLRKALTLNEEILKHFWDDEGGGFYFTPDDAEKLLFRQKEIYDGAVPSGNSVAMLNLLRLEQITGNSEFGEKAARIGRTFANEVKSTPIGFTQLMVALEFAISPSCQVMITGDLNSTDTQAMLKALRNKYLPNKIVLLNPIDQESAEIYEIAEFLKKQPSIGGKATAYVCINDFCKKPVTEVSAMLEQLALT